MKIQKKFSIALFLISSMFFYNTATAQLPGGQHGSVCASYDACTNVEIGYFIYPNPAKDVLNIDLTSMEQATLILDLFDAKGQQVIGFEQIVVVEGRVNRQLNLTGLSAGYYFVRIKDATRNTLETIKFMKS